jgi:hypothetical protein
MSTKSSSILFSINRWSANFFKKRWVLTAGTVLAIVGIAGKDHRSPATLTISQTPIAEIPKPVSASNYASLVKLPPQGNVQLTPPKLEVIDLSLPATVAIDPLASEVTTQLSTKTVPTTISTNTSRSLATGTNITPPAGVTGLGTLKVINGTRQDAAIKLVDRNSGKTYRFVYIQANREIVLNGIGACLCTLKFTVGNDWDSRSRRFLRNSAFSQFDQALNFREVRTASGVQWMNYTATLHPTSHGKARTNPISERDF